MMRFFPLAVGKEQLSLDPSPLYEQARGSDVLH
jgi:hypothetical protein